MPTLLHLDSSADQLTSRSRAITRTLADAWRDAAKDRVVVYRDLHAEPLPHLPDASLHWPTRLRASNPPEWAANLQAQLIEELLHADAVVIGVPLYNYSMPSTLKAWIDYIHVPGLTAPFDVPTQPLAGRPVVIVSTRGGVYDPGTPTDGWDHALPPLELILGRALGMSITKIISNLTLAETVPTMHDQIGRSREELADALATAALAGRSLSESP